MTTTLRAALGLSLLVAVSACGMMRDRNPEPVAYSPAPIAAEPVYNKY